MAFELTAAPRLCVTSVSGAIEFYERCFGFARQNYFSGNEVYVVMKLGHAEVHLYESPRANPNHIYAEHVADAFIWVPSIEPVVSLATKNGLKPVRGPERYGSSPVATIEVVYPDNSDYWICFSEAHH
jgi:hypothetical protein